MRLVAPVGSRRRVSGLEAPKSPGSKPGRGDAWLIDPGRKKSRCSRTRQWGSRGSAFAQQADGQHSPLAANCAQCKGLAVPAEPEVGASWARSSLNRLPATTAAPQWVVCCQGSQTGKFQGQWHLQDRRQFCAVGLGRSKRSPAHPIKPPLLARHRPSQGNGSQPLLLGDGPLVKLALTRHRAMQVQSPCGVSGSWNRGTSRGVVNGKTFCAVRFLVLALRSRV